MRGLARVGPEEIHRVRRWDVVVLGGALPGLVAAVSLGQRGARVLIVEEAAAFEDAALLREPFLMTGAESGGVLGACLRSLGVPLIDQRRFAREDVAVQVVLPDARVDVGRAALFAAELVAWGLAKPETARGLVRALEGAAEAERRVMLEAPASRGARRWQARAHGGQPAPPVFARGWPREAVDAPEPVGHVLEALVRGLSQLGAAPPSPEARARLVGGVLAGASVLGGGAGLGEMLRRRAKALFAEFRRVEPPFALASVAGQPALALPDTEEIWAGRALVLNAPAAGLARVLGDAAPAVLQAVAPTRRRVQRRFRGPREAFPEAMAGRVICLPDPGAGGEPPVITLRRAPAPGGRDCELVASAVGPADAPADAMGAWIERVVRRLVPFSEERLRALPVPEPLWDTDALLGDPEDGGWPRPARPRLSARPALFQLDRASVGGLGFEGDLLLGLRGADAIADELP